MRAWKAMQRTISALQNAPTKQLSEHLTAIIQGELVILTNKF